MLFHLNSYEMVVKLSYSYMKNICIYAACGTLTEILEGQAGNSSACAMDTIWNELKRNNIEIDVETLSFYIDTCPREHE